MRPLRSEILMKIAHIVAERGTCDRKQVGAVIAREGRIITVGYNGAPPGLTHCSENGHGWYSQLYGYVVKTPDGFLDIRQDPEIWTAVTTQPDNPEDGRTAGDIVAEHVVQRYGCRNATHAEANALAFAAKYGVSTDGAELFVTVSPCQNCARLLIAAGITAVYYEERYRDTSGLELLFDAGLKVVGGGVTLSAG